MPLSENLPETEADGLEMMNRLRIKYPKNIIIGYININSIRNKFDGFSQIMSNKVDILIVAETKLDSSFRNGQFMINGFGKPIRLDVSSNSGGLLVYIRNGIISKQLKDLEIPNDIEVVPIEINIRKQKWLLLPLYRNPLQNQTYFVDNISRIIDRYSAARENVLILGDFNMEANDKALVPLVEAYKLYSLIKGPTCFKSERGRCIDLMLTNRKHSFMGSQSFETGFSDHHHLIYTVLKSTFVKLPPKIVKYREYKTFCEEEFQKDLEMNLRQNFPTEYSAFQAVLSRVLEKHAPLKQRAIRGNNKQHCNKNLRKAMMTRSTLKNKSNKSGKTEDFEKYKKQRNLVVKMNRKAKFDFYRSIEPRSIANEKTFWKAVKPMFSNGNPMGEKIVLIEDEVIISDDAMIAECFNSHFVNITDSLGLDPMFKQIPNCIELDEKVEVALMKYRNHPSIIAIKHKVRYEKKFQFYHVYPWDVMNFVEALDASKSTSGNIPTKIIKMAKDILCPYLTDCINAAIQNCSFPDELKKADVSSIFKQDDSSWKGNYRPISVLSALSKVYERIIGVQMDRHFATILSHLLSGFRQGYSTQHALFRAIESWKRCLDTKGIVGTILMDLSKAYDCIPHDLLIAKLEAYGLDTCALKLVYSYLTNRKQRVKVGSAYSTFQNISTGVPQGSVLGPLLFNIFINDLFFTDLESEICNFADDTTIYACDTSIDAVTIKLKDDLQKPLDWFKNNGMCANPAKFQMMFLGLKSDKSFILNIGGQQVKQSEQVKLLGVQIDNSLKFDAHVKELCRKINQKLCAFSRIRPFLNEEKAKMLLTSVVMSNFSYCPLVWLFCSKTANKDINRTNKRALRVLYGDYDSSVDQLLARAGSVTVHQKNLQSLMIEIYKTMNHLNPSYIWEFFVKKDISYNLRTKELCRLPSAKSHRYGLNSLSFRGSLLWNTLDDELKRADSLGSFKTGIKEWDGKGCRCLICK